MARLCEGIKTNGSPCTFKARFSSRYCATHASQAPKPCPTHRMTLDMSTGGPASAKIEFLPETGGVFVGTLDAVNALLKTLGYAEVAVRVNMMSREFYLEAKDTPVYLSPACETYWSM